MLHIQTLPVCTEKDGKYPSGSKLFQEIPLVFVSGNIRALNTLAVHNTVLHECLPSNLLLGLSRVERSLNRRLKRSNLYCEDPSTGEGVTLRHVRDIMVFGFSIWAGSDQRFALSYSSLRECDITWYATYLLLWSLVSAEIIGDPRSVNHE